jgi:hypothetical protein
LRHYFAGNVEALRNALRAAQAKGFIEVSTELVRPWQHSGTALAIFQAGDPALSAGQIAYQASQRWSGEMVPSIIIRATAQLTALHGGKVRAIASGHLSHEIALAEVFLAAKRQSDPDFEWSLVHARPGTGALPDAVCATGAIEIVGRYSGASVAAKLVLAGSMNLELW